VLHVTRESLSDLDMAGRKDRRSGKVEFRPGDGLIFRPGNNDTPTAVQDVTGQSHPALWPMVDDLMTRLERKTPALPELIASDPALLARFTSDLRNFRFAR
jgi:hypothetical protein